MVYRINKHGAVEQIYANLGGIWKDGYEWKIRLPEGIWTEATKKGCVAIRAQMVKDGLIK